MRGQIIERKPKKTCKNQEKPQISKKGLEIRQKAEVSQLIARKTRRLHSSNCFVKGRQKTTIFNADIKTNYLLTIKTQISSKNFQLNPLKLCINAALLKTLLSCAANWQSSMSFCRTDYILIHCLA